jgi:hypothetical protein
MSLLEFIEFHCDLINVLKIPVLEEWIIHRYGMYLINFWKFVFQMKPFTDSNLFQSIDHLKLLLFKHKQFFYFCGFNNLLEYCLKTVKTCPAFCLLLTVFIDYQFTSDCKNYNRSKFEIDTIVNVLDYNFNNLDKVGNILKCITDYDDIKLRLFYYHQRRKSTSSSLLVHYRKQKLKKINHLKFYLLWLISSNSPNKDCYLYLLPTDISRLIIHYVA